MLWMAESKFELKKSRSENAKIIDDSGRVVVVVVGEEEEEET